MTHCKCNWASRVFDDWFAEHKKTSSDPVLLDIIDNIMNINDEGLVYVVTRFILEVKKQNRNNCPAEILYQLVMCLQLFMFIQGHKVKFLNDENFRGLKLP